MKQLRKILFIIVCCLIGSLGNGLHAQMTYIDSIKFELDDLALQYPGLNQKVEFSVSGVSVKEFLRGVASNHELNVSISDDVGGRINNNFASAVVKDVFIFLCKEYNLEIRFIGSIMSFHTRPKPIEEPEPVIARIPKVDFNDQNSFLSLDLKNDTLDKVVEEITRKSMSNVIIAPELQGKIVSVYIRNRPFENTLEMLADANGIELKQKEKNVFIYQKKSPKSLTQNQPGSGANGTGANGSKGKKKKAVEGLKVTILPENKIDVEAINVPIKEILAEVSRESSNNYFLYSEPSGNASIFVKNANYDEFLSYLLSGSKLTYKYQDQVYLIGERNKELLRTTELVRLENRTVESILDFIPAEMRKGVDIKEFKELNGLILSGSSPNIREIRTFINQVDQVVPVVKIEVLIVDFKKSNSLNAGVDFKLGIGQGTGTNATIPTKTTGEVSGGLKATLASTTVNNLIQSMNGFSWINLGKVTPDFYMSLQALESNGNVKVRSTPMLSTLNGHEASMKIGNEQYYLETNTSLVGTQNPVQQTSQQYKSVNADLSLKIKPFVSSDDQVTLEIEINQSDFTARISESAPPGKTSRNFKSLIRLKEGEMILLGGLESKRNSDTGSGLPVISRIPVLKWIFGKRVKENSKTKLHLFIKPTVIY